MTVVCEHVTANYQAIPLREPGQVKVRCPCCGLTAWREPDDDLDGDDCPYCYVQSERMTTCSDTCDTRAGYLRHRKAGEEPCQASSDANAAYSRGYRRQLGLGPRTLTPRRLI